MENITLTGKQYEKLLAAADEAVSSSTLLDAVREAFLAGEKQGQLNAKEIYRSSYPETEPDEAADKYVLKFEASNEMVTLSQKNTGEQNGK